MQFPERPGVDVCLSFHELCLNAASREMPGGFPRLVTVGVAMTEEGHAMPLGKVPHEAEDADALARCRRVGQLLVYDDDVHVSPISRAAPGIRDNPARTPTRGCHPNALAAAVQSNCRRPIAERKR